MISRITNVSRYRNCRFRNLWDVVTGPVIVIFVLRICGAQTAQGKCHFILIILWFKNSFFSDFPYYLKHTVIVNALWRFIKCEVHTGPLYWLWFQWIMGVKYTGFVLVTVVLTTIGVGIAQDPIVVKNSFIMMTGLKIYGGAKRIVFFFVFFLWPSCSEYHFNNLWDAKRRRLCYNADFLFSDYGPGYIAYLINRPLSVRSTQKIFTGRSSL